MKNILLDLRSDHLSGRRRGMVSICSARWDVLAAAIESARSGNDHLLIEATANQVNQFGGYSGRTPAAFALDIDRLAAPRALVIVAPDLRAPGGARGAGRAGLPGVEYY